MPFPFHISIELLFNQINKIELKLLLTHDKFRFVHLWRTQGIWDSIVRVNVRLLSVLEQVFK